MKLTVNWKNPALWVPIVGIAVWALILVATVSQINQPFPGFRLGYTAMVSDFNEPRWTGVVAGLRSGDVIKKVDGRPVATGRDVLAHVKSLPVGTTVKYEVVREGKAREMTIATQRLGVLDFLSSFGVFAAIGFLMLLIGGTAAYLKPDNRSAMANLWLSTGMALSFSFANEYDLTQLFHPVLYYASNLVYASAALSMALNFPDTPASLLKRPWLQWLPYAFGALMIGVMVQQFAALGWTPEAEATAIGFSFVWPTLVLVVAIAVFVLRLRGLAEARARNQIKVLLLGMGVAYLPVVFLDMIPRAITGQPPLPLLTNLSYALRIFFPLALAYAIVKHAMFDITIIIKRTTTYATLTAFLVGGYFGMAALIRTLATWVLGAGHSSDLENVLATAIIAVAFVPVRTAVTAAVDKIFHRTKYDFREVVARVTTRAQSSLDISGLKREFLEAIDGALHPRYMYILNTVPQGDLLTTMGTQATIGDVPMPELKIFLDDPLLQISGKEGEVQYVPKTGLTGMLSPLAALGPHYRVPLQVGEEVVGMVILGPKRSDEEYSGEDRQLLAATRLPLATAIKTAAMVDDKLFKDRMDQELKRAREVQEAMLPRTLPVMAGFDFAASSVPCLEASGDYYDFLELPDGRLGIAVADVAGKGIAAALATAMAKSGLYNQAQTDPEVIPVMTALNRLLHNVTKNASAKSFTTCLYALLDPKTRKLDFSCAGHFPPHHYDATTGTITQFSLKGGFPLGVRDKSKYTQMEVSLNPGDILVFYTDGVTEAQAPAHPVPGLAAEPNEPFESERLSEILLANKDRSAAEIHDAIKNAVDAFVAGYSHTDDITIVVVKVAEPPVLDADATVEVEIKTAHALQS